MQTLRRVHFAPHHGQSIGIGDRPGERIPRVLVGLDRDVAARSRDVRVIVRVRRIDIAQEALAARLQ